MKFFEFEKITGVWSLFRESWRQESDARPAIKTIGGFFFIASIAFACGWQEQGLESIVGYVAFVFGFFGGCWVHATVSNDSPNLWPSQFRSYKAFRHEFFNLKNYPNIKDPSIVLRGLRWCNKNLKKRFKRGFEFTVIALLGFLLTSLIIGIWTGGVSTALHTLAN